HVYSRNRHIYSSPGWAIAHKERVSVSIAQYRLLIGRQPCRKVVMPIGSRQLYIIRNVIKKVLHQIATLLDGTHRFSSSIQTRYTHIGKLAKQLIKTTYICRHPREDANTLALLYGCGYLLG